MKHFRENIRRKHLNFIVVLHYNVIVELTCVSNLLFKLSQLFLKINKILICLKRRICLCNRKNIDNSARKHVFRFGTLLHGRAARRQVCRLCSCLRYGFKNFRFVRSIAFNGLHKIGNQVRTLLKLHVDLRPSVLHAVAQINKTVVAPCDNQSENQYNRDNYY